MRLAPILASTVLASTALALAVVTLAIGAPAAAAPIVRDADLIATMPIHEVTLATPVEEAFNHLYEIGFRTDGVETYADWTTSGIEMVRGAASAPEGFSTLVLQRANGHIVNIAETWNRPQQRFDLNAEIGALQNHFGLAADEHDCHVNATGTGGGCRIGDAHPDADLVYGLSAFPTMLMRYATRNHELKDAE